MMLRSRCRPGLRPVSAVAQTVAFALVLGITVAPHAWTTGLPRATAAGPEAAPAGGRMVEFTLLSRDPATGEPRESREVVEAARVGVVAVDVWNWHWCKTATMRVDALVPRIDHALEAARELGMTVMLCPSDVVENYVGWPQRERVLALDTEAVPDAVAVDCPPVPDAGGCACGRIRCGPNYGWDAMHAGLRIGPDDWMPDSGEEVWTICRERGLTHLVYVGFHTQVCLLGKPMGLRAMKRAGLQCILARDMTDAHPGYDPARGFTPDLNTTQVVEHFERHLAPTIDFRRELARLGRWDDDAVAEPVRVTPWGTAARPHLFEDEVTVTLAMPLDPAAEIRYTLDGSIPGPSSPRYERPLVLAESATVRTAPFRDGRLVGREGAAAFERLGPPPPAPDVPLGDIVPVRSVGFGHTYGGEVRYSGDSGPPQADRSNRGGPIRIDRRTFDRGLGVHAPCEVVYALEPRYRRFVAFAGVDEAIVDRSHGSNLARHPSVVFKVVIDGREAARSPVMRIQSPAWRFDVAIPEGARRIALVAMDAGDGNREDWADWAEAGFVVAPE